MTPVLILVGPTASGKSAVAYELAQRVGGDIISADSMQVYRQAPLLTQQPPTEWQTRIPHHLIGTHDVSATWSAAEFRAAALERIEAIHTRGRLPIIVGGTGLYVRALLDGLCEAPEAQPVVRERLMAEVASEGNEVVHRRLAAVDPRAAGKIHPHDTRRIVRALEVYEVTGEPISRRWDAQPQVTLPFPWVLAGLNWPRAVLYDRINARVLQMFAAGVVDEVRALLQQPLSLTATQMLGLSAIHDHIEGRVSLDETIRLVQQQTRQYARRQMMWFKREARIRWLACEQATTPDLVTQLLALLPA